jgi:cytochrome b561
MVADALFALLLAGLLVARFRWWLKYSPPVGTADIRLFSRQLTRTVYLVLYLIIGAKQVVSICGGYQAEGGAQNLGMLEPTSQVFLVYGLIALVLIRVLAYLTWRRYRFFGRANQTVTASPALHEGLRSG